MNLFYIKRNQINDQTITITGEDVNHIKNVLRMRQGEQVMVCDCEGLNYLSTIRELGKEEVILEIDCTQETKTELPAKIYLFQGLPKKDKMDLIIQKAVELGVTEIIPVAMKRSVVKIEDKKKEIKKLERWNLIAKSAAEQSKRGIVPRVNEVLTYGQALDRAKELDMILIPYENAEGMNYSRDMMKKASTKKSIGIFIGPEGGFEDSEISKVKEIGGEVISLGSRILRTETAGFTILSILMFEMDGSSSMI